MFEELDKIVRSALLDIGENESRYEQFLHWGLDAVRDLHSGHIQVVKTKELQVSPYKVADIPKDCMEVLNVGIKHGDRLLIFRRDDALWFRKAKDTNIPTTSVITPLSSLAVTPSFNYYLSSFINNYGESIGRMFGWQVDKEHIGYFRINYACTEIQFNQATLMNGDKVYLEYISDGYEPDAQTLVPKVASMAVRTYIHWMRLQHNDKVFPVAKRQAKLLFEEQINMLNWKMNPITLEDIREVLQERFHMTPKLI